MEEEYEIVKYAGATKVRPVKQKDKHARYHLSLEEMAKLENAAPSNRDRVLISLLGRCGLRRNESRSLRIEDIDFGHEVLNLKITKRLRPRVVPLTSEIARDLKWLVGQRRTGWVFESQKGNRLSNRQINRIVGKAGVVAGIQNPDPAYVGVNPHLLRHSFAYWWKKHSHRQDILSRVLGHSSVRTTEELYGTPSVEDYKEEFKKVWSKEK